MEKFFIYCNSNQIYHALIHNSIYSNALTRTDFSAKTVSFLSKNFIFVTKEKLSDEMKAIGSTDVYYPVVLEMEIDEKREGLPARFVTKDVEIKVFEEVCALGTYDNVENCIGAFVYGEIPISLVSGFFFGSEQEKISFRKSSPDLWFPTELFHVCGDGEEKSTVTKDDLCAAADTMNQLLSEEHCSELDRIIVRRNKKKAVNYYMTEATESWEAGRLKTNVDGFLIRTLDNDSGIFVAECKRTYEALQISEDINFADFLAETDPVLESAEPQENGILFNVVMDSLYRIDDIIEIDRVKYEEIIGKWLDALNESAVPLAGKAAMVIISYVYTPTAMDPDKALEALEGYPVLKALMFFLDQQKNGDFLRNTCKKLLPSERRYAYMMFGAYHGMTEVDGAQKKNRFLETRFEELSFAGSPSNELISEITTSDEAEFCKIQRNTEGAYFGIIPKMSLWYDCKTSLEKLMLSSSSTLEEVYKLMKDSTIPPEEIYSLSEPVVVTISFGGKEQRFELSQKAGLKGLTKDIERAITKLTKQGESFQSEGFKKYLSDPRRYAKFYKKHSDRIQELCGRDQ